MPSFDALQRQGTLYSLAKETRADGEP